MATIKRVFFVGALSLIVASCSDDKASSQSAPMALSVTQPSPVPSPLPSPLNPSALVVFREPNGFYTTDLYDAHERIVQLTNDGDLIVTPDGTHFPGYEVSPDSSYWGPPTYFIGLRTHVCGDFCVFSVRFGTQSGQRRAYVTIDYGHSNPGTLVDVVAASGRLMVTQTSLFPPGTPTLSGTVTELTSSGVSSVAGALVSRGVSAGWQNGVTDQDGFYRISGLVEGTDDVVVMKEGYQQESRKVTINGDMRLEIQLLRNQR